MYNGVGDVGGVCPGLRGGEHANAHVLVGCRAVSLQGREESALVVVIDVLVCGSELSASVPEAWEAVQVDAFRLAALVGLEQARQAHRFVVVHDGDGGSLRGGGVVAQLVVVYDEVVPSDALRQQVVGDELVQYVHRVGVVVVVRRSLDIAEEPRLLQVVLDPFGVDFLCLAPQRLLPEAVGLGKEREAEVAVLWYGAGLPDGGVFGQILDAARQVEFLPGLVAIGIERVLQPAGHDEACHDAVAALGLAYPLAHLVAKPLVARRYHAIRLMHKAVGQDDAPVALVDGGHTFYADAVQVDLAVKHTQLAVVHVCHAELTLVVREVGYVVGRLVAVVYDAVEYNHVLDAVQHALFGEPFPRGFLDEPPSEEGVKICLYGIVGGCEDGVVPACREQLLQRRLGEGADAHLAEQPHILAVVVFLFEVLRDGLAREHVSCRCVNLVRAACQGQNDGSYPK